MANQQAQQFEMDNTIGSHPRPEWVRFRKPLNEVNDHRRTAIILSCKIEAEGTAQHPMCDYCSRKASVDLTVQCKAFVLEDGSGIICSRCVNRHTKCYLNGKLMGVEGSADEKDGGEGGSRGEISDERILRTRHSTGVGDERGSTSDEMESQAVLRPRRGRGGDRLSVDRVSVVGGQGVADDENSDDAVADEYEGDDDEPDYEIGHLSITAMRLLILVRSERIQPKITERHGNFTVNPSKLVKRPTSYLEEHIRKWGRRDDQEPPTA